MAVAIARTEMSSRALRVAASRAKDAKAARRMGALALLIERVDRKTAAETCRISRAIAKVRPDTICVSIITAAELRFGCVRKAELPGEDACVIRRLGRAVVSQHLDTVRRPAGIKARLQHHQHHVTDVRPAGPGIHHHAPPSRTGPA